MISPSSAPAAASATRPRTARRRTTSRRVRLIDRLTTVVITGGGVLVIVAVLAILIFLVFVVLPLFRGASVSAARRTPVLTAVEAADVVLAEVDEYRSAGVALGRGGEVVSFDPATGAIRERLTLFSPSPRATVFARDAGASPIAVGFEDGTVRVGRLSVGGNGLDAELDAPVAIGTSPVALLDHREVGEGQIVTALLADGRLSRSELRRRENLATGEVSVEVVEHALPFDSAPSPPAFLLQNGRGDQVYVAWTDGTVRRYDLRRIAEPVVAETIDLVPEPDAALTELRFMLGEQSVVAGDSLGRVNVWFRVSRPGAPTEDGYQMVAAHRLDPHRDTVSRIAMSSRDKGLISATESGEIWLRHMTSGQVLARVALATGVEAVAVQITPKADGIFALDTAGTAWMWDLHNPHPETTMRTIFGKVWYEGYDQPSYTWQSSSGSDDFEPKFSLVPLVFGTLKATLYSLLFAVPIALCGAIYTSQFLPPRLRTPIKSAVETMASLPSVVLGFVAALVLAPVIENWVVAVLAALALAPLCALTSGYLWQLLPQNVRLRYQHRLEMPLMMLAVVAGIWLAGAIAEPAEALLFGGDFKAWLDGRTGVATPALALLAWPIAVIAVWLAQRAMLAGWLDRRLAQVSPLGGAATELARFLVVLAVGTGLAWLLGSALAALGLDPRDALVGTYVQRNTLIVGFVMGFAVVPIIYTISEDALSSVPEHLRTASLACGATPWQTAMRVILPVAMSGIFSAIMIGLGRAVGETMIVVMAAGNTPVMDLNIFNGLRALSANIVVEMPEAVRDSTLYRMLFLAALSLFAVTFAVNTVAEIIRIRFRKRAYQL